MNNLTITKTFSAATIIIAARMVKLDSEGVVSQAVDNTDPVLGVAEFGCTEVGDALGITFSGPNIEVELGETMAAGDYFGADATGRAVAAVEGKFRAGRLLTGGGVGDLALYLPGDSVHVVAAA